MVKTATTFKLNGSLSQGQSQVDDLLAKQDMNLILDFAAVTFVSVEGLEWLEELLLRANSMSKGVSFINVPTSIYKVFKVSRIDSLMKACGSMALTGPNC